MNDPTPVGKAAIDMPAATLVNNDGEVEVEDMKCSISSDNHGPHVTLTIRLGNFPSRAVVNIRMPPGEAAYVASQLVEESRRAYDHRLQALVKGDCVTCGNLRMIQDPEKDRPWSIHCPDCTQTEPTPIPTLATWPDAEVEP